MARTVPSTGRLPSLQLHSLWGKNQMNRRDILKAGVAAGAIGLAPRLASAQAAYSPMPKGWRSYVLTMRIEPTGGATKAWIPLPTFEAADWQRPGNVTWTGNAKVTERVRDPKYGAEMLRVEWAADQQSPLVEVTAQVQAQDRALVPGQGNAAPLTDAERKLNLAATELLPTDGLVQRHRAGHRQRQAGRRRQGARASTNGWSTTPSAIPRPWAAAWATSPP